MASKTTIRVALDWTPNTIHSGLFCALEKGFYSDQNLDVQLLPPNEEYTSTPAKRVQNGDVDLAVCPSESVIAYNETGRMKLQAIYAILQKDASAIASTKLQSISKLEGGTYGSYNAKYEDDIVKAMVANAGGKGDGMQIKSSTGKFSLFDEVKKGALDATWVFMPWEGVEAELEGVKLHAFRPEDHGVPYGYSPVIARNAASSLDADVLRKFVKATAKGYEYAREEPNEVAALLAPHCMPEKSAEFLNASQERINGFYLEEDLLRIGQMRKAKWEAWTSWLEEKKLLQGELRLEVLFTNEFFE
jgi:ABC-type nitrate/sulfonate/bicarbonate transport system substrate-binding protein